MHKNGGGDDVQPTPPVETMYLGTETGELLLKTSAK